MYYEEIIQFLKNHNCDLTLLNYVIQCKNKLYESNINFDKNIYLETSIKYQIDGKIKDNRYVIEIDLVELNLYDEKLKEELFSYLGFEFSRFDFKNYKKVQYIYLGIDDNKGKIYLGNETSGICFESNAKIKYYKLSKKNWVDIFLDRDETKLGAIHIRIKDNKIIKWYGIGKDFLTIYHRPYIENKKYKIWFYHRCFHLDDHKCSHFEENNSFISFIEAIHKMNGWKIISMYYIIFKIIALVVSDPIYM